MSCLAIITARGGSKRIPRKNIRGFYGKPIIAYPIEAAVSSCLFEEVMVSTDDSEIAAIAQSCGAVVPFLRSEAASNDFATSAMVIQEVLQNYRAMGKEYEMFCCLYPTAPFVTASRLQQAALLLKDGADCVLTVTEFSYPPQRGLVKRNGQLTWWQPENKVARSQDLEPVLHDAGQFYFRNTQDFLMSGELIGGNIVGVEVPETEVQDIDNESDWLLAEMKYERMISGGTTTR